VNSKPETSPRRILVRGTNWIGDAVMTTPALLRLREKFPGAHIALLTREKLRELWLNHLAVDEIISFAPGENVFAVAKKLRAGKFDLALVLPNSPHSTIAVFLAGIPKRIGYERPWRNFFLTQAVASRAGAVKMRKRSVGEIRALVAADVNRRNDRALTSAATSAHQIHEYLNLAAALGVPVVAIFGSTSPELTAPISSGELRHHILKSDAPCSPCFLRECPIDFRCMNGIGVAQVVEAVLKAI
jgi:ADP-heptose:LPS heptosyltransferase